MNADDFGISPGVNQGIISAHTHGIVTAASIMANLPSAADAVSRASEHPTLDLGAHLTLTAGRPLLNPSQVPSLVDRNGAFLVLWQLALRLSLGMVSTQEIRAELGAQLAKLAQLGAKPSHLDSHHHIHIHPVVRPVVDELASEQGIRWVRHPREPLGHLPGAGPLDLVRVAVISVAARASISRRRFPFRIGGSLQFRGIALGMGFGSRALTAQLRQLPRGTTELMAHPGFPDRELAQLTSFTGGREAEYAALVTPEVTSLLEEECIQLTTFRDLPDEQPYTGAA
ncbi:MAG: ChbG/HpnK family deacetylase [Chloroflexota bacterium]